jgi:hypothetical protein
LEVLEDRLVPSGFASVSMQNGNLVVDATQAANITVTAGQMQGTMVIWGYALGPQGSQGAPLPGDDTLIGQDNGSGVPSFGHRVEMLGVTGDVDIRVGQNAKVVLQTLSIPGRLIIDSVDNNGFSMGGTTPTRRNYDITLDRVLVQGDAQLSGSDTSLVQNSLYQPTSNYTTAKLQFLNSEIDGGLGIEYSQINLDVVASKIVGHPNVLTHDSSNTVRLDEVQVDEDAAFGLGSNDYHSNSANTVVIRDSQFFGKLDVAVGDFNSTVSIGSTTIKHDTDLNGGSSTGFFDQGGNQFQGCVHLDGGITQQAMGAQAATTASASMPAAPPSGPRVVQSWAARDHVLVTFDHAINVSSFTTAQVAVYDQYGASGRVISVTPVANSGNHSFDVYFQPFASGGYRMVIGPNITDTAGNAMNQNANNLNGETPGDQFTIGDFIKPTVVSVVPAWGRIHVTFSKPIDPATLTTSAVQFTDLAGNLVPVQGIVAAPWSNGCEFDILVAHYPKGGYGLTLATTISDYLGNRLAAKYSVAYKDTTPPKVVSITGSRAWYGVTVQFSQPLDESRVSPAAFNVLDKDTGKRVLVTAVNPVPYSDGTQFDIRFQADPGNYQLTTGPGLWDLFGLQMAGPSTLSFQVTTQPPATLASLTGANVPPYLAQTSLLGASSPGGPTTLGSPITVPSTPPNGGPTTQSQTGTPSTATGVASLGSSPSSTLASKTAVTGTTLNPAASNPLSVASLFSPI